MRVGAIVLVFVLCDMATGEIHVAGKRKGWLAGQQRADGGWAGKNPAVSDPATTGLALLAFLGAGYTDRSVDNKYAHEVRAGLRYLRRAQDETGRIGNGPLMEHAIATLALSEAAWQTDNPLHRHYAQQAIDALAAAEWPDDILTTGWGALAMRSAQFGKLRVPDSVVAASRRRIEANRDPGPRAASVRLRARIMHGGDPRKSKAIRREADVLSEKLLAWTERDDMYWLFGTWGMFQVSGSHWKRWNKSMRMAIVRRQWPRGAGEKTGSWDPAPNSGFGRVGTTAMLVMCLSVYYRYDVGAG